MLDLHDVPGAAREPAGQGTPPDGPPPGDYTICSTHPGMRGSALVGLDGELVGFVGGHRLRWYDGWHFYIAEMAVARSRQRTGLGSQLLRTFLDSLDSLDSLDDVSGVYLLTEAHGAASSFYEGHGFRPASRQSVMTRF